MPDPTIRHAMVLRTLWERSAVVADFFPTSQQAEKVLCVPLVALQRTIGVIYLVCFSPTETFGRDHVNFVSSVAAITAVTLESLLAMESLRTENRQLRQQLAADEPMIGESLQMLQLAETVDKLANGDSTVLIRGESGVGKEIVARSIHQKSSRSAHPFIAINCAAIPENLIESELFGYEKGAFTGAVSSKRGKLELAAGGTLFLDEIGELDTKLQAKLLRVLQQREFERVGGTSTLHFNARVLAATNKDLERAIATREFRQDLFYRLNVVSVSVPSLREHREDIPLLAIHFARKYAPRLSRPSKESRRKHVHCYSTIAGREMCANWKMRLNTPWSWAAPTPSCPTTCLSRCQTKISRPREPASTEMRSCDSSAASSGMR